MKRYSETQTTGRLFALCTGVFSVFVFAGLVVSFRMPDGIIGNGADFVSGLSFEDAEFLPSFRRAVTFDMLFCLASFLFGAAFPVSVLTGGYILFKGFLIGSILGLAAGCCAFEAASEIVFALFISNVLVLPLYILLFLISVRFSYKACGMSPGDKTVKFLGFGLRVLIFFGLMCLAELLQTGAGILVLK